MEKLETLVLNTFVSAMLVGKSTFDKDDIGSNDKSDTLLFEYSSDDKTMTISYEELGSYIPILKLELLNIDPQYAIFVAYCAVKEWIN